MPIPFPPYPPRKLSRGCGAFQDHMVVLMEAEGYLFFQASIVNFSFHIFNDIYDFTLP